MEELIDVLDEFGNPTGVVKKKSEIKKDGNYHRVIAVLVINNKDEILMQKRHPNKKVYPNLWSIFVKGHVQAGETPKEACIRELKEEVGLDASLNELEYLYTIKEEVIKKDFIERAFFDTYIFRKDFSIDDVVYQEEELAGIKLVDSSEVISLIKNNDSSLVPNYEDYKRIIDIIKRK